MPHQLTGAVVLKEACNGPFRGAILGDEMGLGKTLTAIMACMMDDDKRGSFNLVATNDSRVKQREDEIRIHINDVSLQHGLYYTSPIDSLTSCDFQKAAGEVHILHDRHMTATELLAQKPNWVIVTYQFLSRQYQEIQAFKTLWAEALAFAGCPEHYFQINNERVMPPEAQRPFLSIYF